jgi:hypothetical protein
MFHKQQKLRRQKQQRQGKLAMQNNPQPSRTRTSPQ